MTVACTEKVRATNHGASCRPWRPGRVRLQRYARQPNALEGLSGRRGGACWLSTIPAMCLQLDPPHNDKVGAAQQPTPAEATPCPHYQHTGGVAAPSDCCSRWGGVQHQSGSARRTRTVTTGGSAKPAVPGRQRNNRQAGAVRWHPPPMAHPPMGSTSFIQTPAWTQWERSPARSTASAQHRHWRLGIRACRARAGKARTPQWAKLAKPLASGDKLFVAQSVAQLTRASKALRTAFSQLSSGS